MVKYLVFPVERELHRHQVTVCWQSPDIQRPPEQLCLVTQRRMMCVRCKGLHWPSLHMISILMSSLV